MMYITLAACMFSSGAAVASSDALEVDDVNLLQAKLSQQSVAATHSNHTHATSGKSTAMKAVRGKGGKGKEDATCQSAKEFCSLVTQQIRGCQDFWTSNGGSCAQSFCSVTDAMQEYPGEKEVLTHDYQDATALRRACKTFAKGRTWGVDGSTAGLQCPTVEQRAAACADPSTSVQTLEMATFCDELEYMCDAWALWFIAAAQDQADEANHDVERYSCDVFAAWNAYTWGLAPGGCASGDSFGELATGTTPTTDVGATSTFEWTDEYEVRLYGNETTMKWEVLNTQFGCRQSADSGKMKPDEAEILTVVDRQACFNECQQRRWCMAVDWAIAETECRLFNWACEMPEGANAESWRLYRSDNGVSWTGGGRLDCDTTTNDVLHGAGEKWSCPAYVSKYSDGTSGCVLPDGPLATCVCDFEAGCHGVETTYDENFLDKYPNRKRLSKAYTAGEGVVNGLKTNGGNDVTYTCVKRQGALLQEDAMRARAERAQSARAEPDATELLDVSLSRKACVESC